MDSTTPLPIKEKTADMVIEALFKDTEELLLRFEQVSKPNATAWDNERDRLRKFIQEKVKSHQQYGRVLLELQTGSSQVYPNAEGKYAITDLTIIDSAYLGEFDANIKILLDVSSVEQLADDITMTLQQGKQALIKHLQTICIAQGTVVDNQTLYKSSSSTKVNIVILPAQVEVRHADDTAGKS